VAVRGDAEHQQEQPAVDQRPRHDVQPRQRAIGRPQNASSGIVAQVGSRDATTPSQAPILGSS
jgi:hypothetical protein